jgi:hypothetical protein
MMMEWAHRRLAMVPPGTAIDINISASARTAPGQGLLPLHGHRRTAISLLAGTSYSAAALSIVSRSSVALTELSYQRRKLADIAQKLHG